MTDELARDLGFDDAAEFHKLVAAVDIVTAEQLEAFKRWQQEDGTKGGLLALSGATQ